MKPEKLPDDWSDTFERFQRLMTKGGLYHAVDILCAETGTLDVAHCCWQIGITNLGYIAILLKKHCQDDTPKLIGTLRRLKGGEFDTDLIRDILQALKHAGIDILDLHVLFYFVHQPDKTMAVLDILRELHPDSPLNMIAETGIKSGIKPEIVEEFLVKHQTSGGLPP